MSNINQYIIKHLFENFFHDFYNIKLTIINVGLTIFRKEIFIKNSYIFIEVASNFDKHYFLRISPIGSRMNKSKTTCTTEN
jgi:hypothetical protein